MCCPQWCKLLAAIPSFLLCPCSLPPSRAEENVANSGGKQACEQGSGEDRGWARSPRRTRGHRALPSTLPVPGTHSRLTQTWRAQVQRASGERSAAHGKPSPKREHIHRVFRTRGPAGRLQDESSRACTPKAASGQSGSKASFMPRVLKLLSTTAHALVFLGPQNSAVSR